MRAENGVYAETATDGSSSHVPEGSGDFSVYGNGCEGILTVKWLFESECTVLARERRMQVLQLWKNKPQRERLLLQRTAVPQLW